MEHLLTTKLYIPRPRLDIIEHKRLIEMVDARMWDKLTLVSAPAGFGKTGLLKPKHKVLGLDVAERVEAVGENF